MSGNGHRTRFTSETAPKSGGARGRLKYKLTQQALENIERFMTFMDQHGDQALAYMNAEETAQLVRLWMDTSTKLVLAAEGANAIPARISIRWLAAPPGDSSDVPPPRNGSVLSNNYKSLCFRAMRCNSRPTMAA